MNPQATTAENELRSMIGDLMMQLAMLRAENINLKAQLPGEAKPNGRAKEEEGAPANH